MWHGINLWAVALAALSSFLLGGFWYSPALFGNAWAKADGRVPGDCKQHGHRATVFAVAIILSIIAAFAFAVYLGPNPPLVPSLITGAVIGICWVATSFGINYLFAGRTLKLFLIDGGYHLFQFLFYALILGLWH